MTRLLLLLVVWMTWPGGVAAGARLVQVDSEPVTVYVKVGMPLAVTFPEGIQAIPTGVDPAHLSLEIEGKRLFIQPLVEGFDARLFVIGVSGRMYQLRLTEREGEDEPDNQVELIQPVTPAAFGVEAPASVGQEPLKRRERRTENPLRRLLVAMIEGRKLPGVSVVDHAQTLFDQGNLEIYTLQLYVAGRYLGYLAVAENRGADPVALRLPEYQAPGLKAITAEQETIEAKGTTLVYLVVEPEKQ